MFERRIPEWLRHAPTPGLKGFAVLAGIESAARGVLISVFPLAMYRTFQDAGVISRIYFLVGVASLLSGLLVPWLTRFVPRRWIYTVGASLYLVSAGFAVSGGETAMALALLCSSVATVTVFVCFNAYVLDYISRVELGRCETLRLFYSAAAWTAGPVCGVWLMHWWEPAPFIVSSVAALVLLATFWVLRLGNGKLITPAVRPPPNPLAYLSRFCAQPRLVAGWMFAVLRSCGWWVYVVYLPIFAVESGLGEQVGGVALSITNGLLFVTPVMLRWMQRRSVRQAVRTGFLLSGALFVLAGIGSDAPWLAVSLLMAGSVLLILLDVCAGLPFLMAVKPSERTEMSAIYASYRDVSGILTPGAAWVVLLFLPLSVVFTAVGSGLLFAWAIAGRLHPRLGAARLSGPLGGQPQAG
ncbi:MAG: MFS transporter [Planctomycetes bacterium]|nr:MFS transporter [Planctomycetota bacterium]